MPFHPSGAADPTRTPTFDLTITGTLAWADGGLRVTYDLTGATDRVKVAARGATPSRKDELWRTTCFELFAKSSLAPDYWEYNLAPSGDWNLYRFATYRGELQKETRTADIEIATDVAPSGLTRLRATLPLPPPLDGRELVIGISSVIEDHDGRLHYYALRHGGAKPDFHDPAGFVLNFDPTVPQ